MSTDESYADTNDLGPEAMSRCFQKVMQRIVDVAGTCECTCEPRGEHGLEGWGLGNVYKFEHCISSKTGGYYRIYPPEKDQTDMNNPYYETCSPGIFRRFFRITGTDWVSCPMEIDDDD